MFAFQFNGINRLGELRQDQQYIAQLLQQTSSYFLPTFEQTLPIVSKQLAWLSCSQLTQLVGTIAQKHLIYLGNYKNKDYFSYRVQDPSQFSSIFPQDRAPEFVGLRQLIKQLPSEQAYLANIAIGVNHWHQSHQYCNKCGALSYASQLGFVRHCSNPDCKLEHFPRTDPAVIAAITYKDKILLGRQVNWPETTFSVIAGFVEPGESLEQAVSREALEETGIEVENAQYCFSQPWPFPQSLMVGFTAQALNDEIQLKDKELESAAWFSRSDIRAKVQAEQLKLPNSYSISRALIEQWLAKPLL